MENLDGLGCEAKRDGVVQCASCLCGTAGVLQQGQGLLRAGYSHLTSVVAQGFKMVQLQLPSETLVRLFKERSIKAEQCPCHLTSAISVLVTCCLWLLTQTRLQCQSVASVLRSLKL